MKVCIAEKPSVAREIAAVLGATQRKDGYIEGNGYQVTWTFGNLCTLKEPHDYHSEWKGWNYSTLPMIPAKFGIKLISDSGYQKQFGIIEGLVKNADEVINCGDAGQEGELIQRWVLQKAGATCPIKRLWISSLTEEAIREGFSNLRDNSDFQRLYEAGLARAMGDWLLGMNATRIYTLKYSQNRQVLSIGRVQTPTLALIVNRQLEIANFEPEPYWELKTEYRDVVFSSVKGKYKSEEAARIALQNIEGEEFVVKSIVEKKGKESAPRLFDLTSLQVECNKKFAYSADETLKLIQSLYEKKLTTYPRVDTTFLSDDIYPKIPTIMRGLVEYKEFTEPILKAKILKSKKVFNNEKVTDHHAIIPTGTYHQNITAAERNVYDLVVRHFIANFYPESKISTTTVLGESGGEEFKVTGKVVLDPAWRVLFVKESVKGIAKEILKEAGDEEKNDKERVLPQFVQGESGEHKPDLAQKFTSPPKLYTEATLLRAMETAGKSIDDEKLRDAMKENGIGRPSTRASIIETLFRRNYIRKERKNLIATQTGLDLIAFIPDQLLKSAELTGQWEKKLRDIERGEYQTSTFVDELKTMVSQVVLNVKLDNKSRKISLDVPVAKELKKKAASRPRKPKNIAAGMACPKCGKGLVIKGKTALGCSLWQSGCDWREPFSE